MFLKLNNLLQFTIGEKAPRNIFIAFIFYIVVIEFGIMFLFELLEYDNHMVNASIDTLTLLGLTIPAFYFLVYKPSLAHIIETKDLAKKIKQSEKKFKNAFKFSAIGMALISPEGKWLKVNSQVCQIVGFSEEELLRMTFQDITHPDDLTKDLNFVKQMLAGKIETYHMEKRYFNKQGSIVWVLLSVSLVKDSKENPLYFISQIQDITHRKIAEDKLSKSQQQFRNLVDSTDGIVWEADAQTFNFTYVSQQAERLLGYTTEEWKEEGFWAKHIYSEDKEFAINYCVAQTKQKLSHDFEYRFVSKDGRIVWLRDIVNVVVENNEPHRLRGVIVDITSKKENEEKINFQNVKLKKLNAEKDKFFSIIAHDLRGPFNGFLGLTELLAEKNSSLKPEMARKLAENMHKSAQQLFVLLENLLQWARSKRGLVSFEPVNIELNSILIENIHLIKASAQKKDVEILINIPNNTIVIADINMANTIIRNLISNALKFTPNGGEISVSAKINEGNKVVIAVKDFGIGMNQTLLDNLFRIDVQTNRKGINGEPSSGLGLLLCKDFVEKNDGKIWVESQENKGSTFYFTLPTAGIEFL